MAGSARLGWLRSRRSASLLRDCAASAIAQAGSGFTPANRKPQEAEVMPSGIGGQGLTVRRLITPHPPPGGFGRPSNITQDYAHISYVSGGGRAVLARLDPRPRNQRYAKWPRRYRSKRCAAHARAWCLRPLPRLSPRPLSSPTHPASGCGRLRPLRVLRLRPQPAAPGCLRPPSEKSVLAGHVGA